MTPEQRAAFIIALAARLTAEIQGMAALNMQRAAIQASMAYDEVAFFQVIDRYPLLEESACKHFLVTGE